MISDEQHKILLLYADTSQIKEKLNLQDLRKLNLLWNELIIMRTSEIDFNLYYEKIKAIKQKYDFKDKL